MPIIRIEILEGRSAEQKQDLVAGLTREAVRVLGCSPGSVYVVIDDVSKDNWGIGGILLSAGNPDK